MSEDHPESGTEVTEPSLDDVISEFQPQASVEPTTPQPTPIPEYQPSYTPQGFDPLDENSVRSYVQSQSQAQSELRQQLQQMSGQLTEMQQRDAQARVEADIEAAVKTLTKEVDVKPIVAQSYLEAIAREKPGFKQIWDNRHANPAALDKAMKAVAKNMKSDFSAKVDPQVVEDQKAAIQSQRAMATTTKTNANDEWEGLSDVEFQHKWNQMVSGG